MSPLDNPFANFLFAQTLPGKARCLSEDDALSSPDAPKLLRENGTGVEDSAHDRFLAWNADALQVLMRCRAMHDETLNSPEVTAVERGGLRDGILVHPAFCVAALIGDLISFQPEWVRQRAVHLARGGASATAILAAWLLELVGSGASDGLSSSQADDLHKWASELVDPSSVAHALPRRLAWAIQQVGRYSPAGLYASEIADLLVQGTHDLAVAAICAAAAERAPKELWVERYELAGLASQRLVSRAERDTSNALMGRLGSLALAENAGDGKQRALELLDVALGECRALDVQGRDDDGELFMLCAQLHIDRAVQRLDVANDGHWLALEDYTQALQYLEKAKGQLTPERERTRVRIRHLLLTMQVEAKHAANVYSDANLVADLSGVIEDCAALGVDDDMVHRAILDRADLLIGASIEKTILGRSELVRLSATLASDDQLLPRVMSRLASCELVLGGSNSASRAAAAYTRAIAAIEVGVPAGGVMGIAKRYELASNWMNLGTARLLELDETPARAFDAYSTAAAVAAQGSHDDTADVEQKLAFTHLQAKALLQAGIAGMLLDSDEALSRTMDAQDTAIELLAARFREGRSACSTEWCDDLASAHLNRAQASLTRGRGFHSQWRSDIDAAIDIRHYTLQTFGDKQPYEGVRRYGGTLLMRAQGLLKRDRIEAAPQALADGNLALRLLENLAEEEREQVRCHELRFDAYSVIATAQEALGDLAASIEAGERAARALDALQNLSWIATHQPSFDVEHAARLARACRHEQALWRLQAAAERRSMRLAVSKTRGGRKQSISLGKELGGLGAWCLATLGRTEEALAFVESNRGFFLRESLLGDAAILVSRCNLTESQAEHIASLHRALDSVRLALSQEDWAAGDATSPAQSHLRSQLVELTATIDRETYGLGLDTLLQPPTVDDLRHFAPTGGAMALPATSSVGTVVFIISAVEASGHVEGLRKLMMPRLKTDTLDQWLQRFVRCESDLFEESSLTQAERLERFEAVLLNLGQEFWTEFLGPVCAFAEAELKLRGDWPLTVVTQGVLDALPLHVAWRSDRGPRVFAIQERVLRFSPGLTALQLLATYRDRRAARGPMDLAAFVNPTGDLGAAATREWPAVAALPWSKPPRALIGPGAATRHAFEAVARELSAGSGPNALHFAMHGHFDARYPEGSGLVFKFAEELQDASMLTVADVLALPRLQGLDFVCLSACQSGVADVNHSPDEFIGLASAFVQVGAGSVLASLYPVLDFSVPDFIAGIYERMLTSDEAPDLARAFRATVSGVISDNVKEGVDARSSDGAHSLRPRLFDWAAFRPICA
ncbi:CHAT domain-containing protein [Variovorax sp. J22P240]|uniref:CHAT domain-containing protein n=1 Tax=Variovorax sp. J22P240 TaxID=3053514 RepID=UPI0025751C3F|nr:CHAT domain-containing protein [Variovorax sp. J22P240]MDM0001204.1 CHAT domain-containing protein [Variovorax sp. J22P240]